MKKTDYGKIVILIAVVVAVVFIGFLISNTFQLNTFQGNEVKDNSAVVLDYTLGVIDSSAIQGIRIIQTTNKQIAIDSNMYSPFNSYEPINVTIGSSDILDAFSEQLIGMKLGEEKTFVIPPENAYGQYNPNIVQAFPVNMINATQLRVGSRITSDIGIGTIIALNATHATIDFNNLLAGYALVYKVRILRIE